MRANNIRQLDQGFADGLARLESILFWGSQAGLLVGSISGAWGVRKYFENQDHFSEDINKIFACAMLSLSVGVLSRLGLHYVRKIRDNLENSLEQRATSAGRVAFQRTS